jgi:thioredoxin 1
MGGVVMLETNLKHVESREQVEELLKDNENVMICCGRMGPMCIPVYAIMEKLEPKYPQVQMRDMDFDIPVASFIINLPECSSFMGLPFTVYFKNGKVVKATSSIQNYKQITDILDEVFKD